MVIRKQMTWLIVDSEIFLGFVPSRTFHAFTIFKRAPCFLGFILSRMFYASAILREPLAFWASFPRPVGSFRSAITILVSTRHVPKTLSLFYE
jgi:hypothetical protein